MSEFGIISNGKEGDMLKIELGGGLYPKGDGFVNVDLLDFKSVDEQCDFEKDPLPFKDNSVDEIFSGHCFEHLTSCGHIIREIMRVAKNGCKIEIRTPHPSHDLAMCPAYMPFGGHKAIFSTWWWTDVLTHFAKDWFKDSGRIIIDDFWFHKCDDYDNHPKNLIPQKLKDLFDSEEQFEEFGRTHLRNYITEFSMIGHVEK